MANIKTPERPVEAIQAAYRGCLLGGAVGDALGAPVEFLNESAIASRFGENGIQEFVPAFGRLGAITDDTQMTLFTAEGILRAHVRRETRGICHPPTVMVHAYLRWLHTQGRTHPLHTDCNDGWLIGHRELFSPRAPGVTCINALVALRDVMAPTINDSKGCGGVMRVAPVGMFFATLTRKLPGAESAITQHAFDFACAAAAITHGHPTGQLSAGVFAVVVMGLLKGDPLETAIDAAVSLLVAQPKHGETLAAIQAALKLAREIPRSASALRQLGEGWVAEEALAISLYCALTAADFRDGVTRAVNHSGDSDSTGSMAGQLLGAIHGDAAIPETWLQPLELRSLIQTIADDLAAVPDWNLDAEDDSGLPSLMDRYPGW